MTAALPPVLDQVNLSVDSCAIGDAGMASLVPTLRSVRVLLQALARAPHLHQLVLVAPSEAGAELLDPRQRGVIQPFFRL